MPHVARLESIGVQFIPPKGDTRLACGDVGSGAMAAVKDIAAAIRGALELPSEALAPGAAPSAREAAIPVSTEPAPGPGPGLSADGSTGGLKVGPDDGSSSGLGV